MGGASRWRTSSLAVCGRFLCCGAPCPCFGTAHARVCSCTIDRCLGLQIFQQLQDVIAQTECTAQAGLTVGYIPVSGQPCLLPPIASGGAEIGCSLG